MREGHYEIEGYEGRALNGERGKGKGDIPREKKTIASASGSQYRAPCHSLSLRHTKSACP